MDLRVCKSLEPNTLSHGFRRRHRLLRSSQSRCTLLRAALSHSASRKHFKNPVAGSGECGGQGQRSDLTREFSGRSFHKLTSLCTLGGNGAVYSQLRGFTSGLKRRQSCSSCRRCSCHLETESAAVRRRNDAIKTNVRRVRLSQALQSETKPDAHHAAPFCAHGGVLTIPLVRVPISPRNHFRASVFYGAGGSMTKDGYTNS